MLVPQRPTLCDPESGLMCAARRAQDLGHLGRPRRTPRIRGSPLARSLSFCVINSLSPVLIEINRPPPPTIIGDVIVTSMSRHFTSMRPSTAEPHLSVRSDYVLQYLIIYG